MIAIVAIVAIVAVVSKVGVVVRYSNKYGSKISR